MKRNKKKMMNRLALVFIALILHVACTTKHEKIEIQGWNILTDNKEKAIQTIEKAREYKINHLQLSHEIIMDLRQVRDTTRHTLIKTLTDKAHKEGIEEVILWDHTLYGLGYYPDKFKTGPNGTIDFDNPEFWEWFRNDYRDMLDLVPDIQGLVLTFIETGARAEDQYSQKMKTKEEKLAAVVDEVAKVVIDERKLKLYIRTFSYTHEEYNNVISAINLIKNQKVILMMKETPHDFFLTHPNIKYAGTIARPTIMEFDCGNEFNGQGVIANTWTEHIVNRWSDFLKRPHVIGYVARTDRYGDTGIIGHPSEILLYTLKNLAVDTSLTKDQISEQFIGKRYGQQAISFVKPAFDLAYDIVTSSLYTLGTNIANHSKLNFDPYISSYGRHVSGKWVDPPVVFVEHGVNKEFHYWKDIIEHLSPHELKKVDGPLKIEAPFVLEQNWVSPVEKMDTIWYNYILAEKQYGIKLATEALYHIEQAKPFLKNDDYVDLYETFHRTLLTTQLYEAVARAYWGYRVYVRGDEFRNAALNNSISKGLDDILIISGQIKDYQNQYPIGQWNWKSDAEMALKYYDLIAVSGWKEYGGIVFPFRE